MTHSGVFATNAPERYNTQANVFPRIHTRGRSVLLVLRTVGKAKGALTTCHLRGRISPCLPSSLIENKHVILTIHDLVFYYRGIPYKGKIIFPQRNRTLRISYRRRTSLSCLPHLSLSRLFSIDPTLYPLCTQHRYS